MNTVKAVIFSCYALLLVLYFAVDSFAADTFFFIGAFWLLLGIFHCAAALREQGNIKKPSGRYRFVVSLFSFAQSNITRNRSRSLLCIALVASTTFLVLSISAFRIDPNHLPNQGVDYIAETVFPVYEDISVPQGRDNLSIQSADEKTLESQGLNILPFRMKDGDSTSCLNLYQTGNPRVLGAPKKIIEKEWSGFGVDWSKLQQPITIDPDGVQRVPVILDSTTAMYALHLYGGIGGVYELTNGSEIIRCEVAGLLNNSVLQGEIVMSGENLLQLFPDTAGYRYFLFGGVNRFSEKTANIFYDMLSDYGFQGESAADRLRKLFAVQNTYLSTFQSLGGIGLLLGIFGLAVIQSRNVFERRKEIALFQAIGFSRSSVILMLLYESFMLLFRGLALACTASLFAVLPFFLGFSSQTASPQSVAVQFVWLVGGMIAIGAVSNVAATLSVLKIPAARELAEER
jgi:hypothetical protein